MRENKFPDLLKELKKASDECWASKIATYEIATKHAPKCIQILQELGYVPRLINNRIEKRLSEREGWDVCSNDFWASADMIIALSNHLEQKFDALKEFKNAST